MQVLTLKDKKLIDTVNRSNCELNQRKSSQFSRHSPPFWEDLLCILHRHLFWYR